MPQIDLFESFARVHPGQFIARFSDWITFTLLLFFFTAVTSIALRKHFQDSRHLRILCTTVGLMLSVGTYYSIYRGWLHFSFQSLGFIGVALILIIVFFITYGLMRGYGMKPWTALPIGYAIFYISLWAISPNVLHNLADIFPLGNGILGFLFIASIVKIVMRFFSHSSAPKEAAIELSRIQPARIEEPEIQKEIREDKQERRMLKGKTAQVTKTEIKTIEDIEKVIRHLAGIIKSKSPNLDQDDVSHITAMLREVSRKESILGRGKDLIRAHANAYQSLHRKDISELEKRLRETTDSKKRRVIEEELTYQKRMIQAIDFLDKYEVKIQQFIESFNRLLYTAMQKLKTNNPHEALSYLNASYQELEKMRSIYSHQKELETYLLKVNKKTIRDLKKEKAS